MNPDFSLKVVSTMSGFQALQDDWNQVYDSSVHSTIFSSWDWMFTWWEVFHDQLKRELLILCLYHNNKLIGIAPFQIDTAYPKAYIQGKTLRFIGAGEIYEDSITSESQDLIVLPEFESELLKAVSHFLINNKNRWSFADFEFLRPGALILKCFNEQDQGSQVSRLEENYGVRFYIPETDSFEHYLGSMGKRWRKMFTKKSRIIERDGKVEISSTDTIESIDPALKGLADMHCARWKGKVKNCIFDSSRFYDFHRNILHRLVLQNKASIKTLSLDGNALAAYYIFEDKGEVHYYQSGFYAKYANRYSPLFLLVVNEIGQAIASQRSFDFMYADHENSYKKAQYAAAYTNMIRLKWTHQSFRFFLYQQAKTIQNTFIKIRSWLHNNEKNNDTKLHILHVIEPMEHGVFIWVVDMANRLVNDGYQVSVLHSIRKNTPQNWRTMFELIHVQMSRAIDPFQDLKALIGLVKNIKKLNPDIIHTHSSKGGFLARVAGFLLGRNKHLLYTSHAIHYPLIEQPLKRKLYKYLEHIGYWLGGTIVACGKEEFEIIKKDITHGNTSRLIRISNGIDISQLTPKDFSIKNKKVKIGVTGRISLQKAPWVFANIARNMNKKRDDVEFIWIGGGNDEDVKNLESAGVTVTGMLDRSDALSLVPTLDIYFQTSAYEGLSLALLEAQASGIPAVVTKIPGNDEVVQHAKTGYVGETEEVLAAHLENLIDSEALRVNMGKKAREYTEEHFSLPVMADQYKREYKRMATL